MTSMLSILAETASQESMNVTKKEEEVSAQDETTAVAAAAAALLKATQLAKQMGGYLAILLRGSEEGGILVMPDRERQLALMNYTGIIRHLDVANAGAYTLGPCINFSPASYTAYKSPAWMLELAAAEGMVDTAFLPAEAVIEGFYTTCKTLARCLAEGKVFSSPSLGNPPNVSAYKKNVCLHLLISMCNSMDSALIDECGSNNWDAWESWQRQSVDWRSTFRKQIHAMLDAENYVRPLFARTQNKMQQQQQNARDDGSSSGGGGGGGALLSL